MRILIAVIFALTFYACKHNSAGPGTAVTSEPVDSGSRSAIKLTDTSSARKAVEQSYQWTKKDKDRFLEDCRKGSDQHLSRENQKGFCECMLLQSQKYYPSYTEMEKKSNDEFDAKILEGCAGYLDEIKEEE